MKKFTALSVLTAAMLTAIALLVPASTVAAVCTDAPSADVQIVVPVPCASYARGSSVTVVATVTAVASSMKCQIQFDIATPMTVTATKLANGTWRCGAGAVVLNPGDRLINVKYSCDNGPYGAPSVRTIRVL